MTDKYIEISKQAAEAAGVDAYEYRAAGKWPEYGLQSVWLCLNNGACAELAAEYRINTIQSSEVAALVSWTEYRTPKEVWALLADHNNDRMLATNYAILSAVIEINKVLADKGEK